MVVSPGHQAFVTEYFLGSFLGDLLTRGLRYGDVGSSCWEAFDFFKLERGTPGCSFHIR